MLNPEKAGADPTPTPSFTSEDRPDESSHCDFGVGVVRGAFDKGPPGVSPDASLAVARGVRLTTRRVLLVKREPCLVVDATARRDDRGSWEKTREPRMKPLPPPRPDVDPASCRANTVATRSARDDIAEVLAIALAIPPCASLWRGDDHV